TGRVLFTNAKFNAHAGMPTIAYRIEEVLVRQDMLRGDIRAVRAAWDHGTVEVSADEAVATASRSERTSARGTDQRALRALFTELTTDGPVPRAKAEAEAERRGFTAKQIRRARETGGFETYKEEGTGKWMIRKRDED